MENKQWCYRYFLRPDKKCKTKYQGSCPAGISIFVDIYYQIQIYL